MGFDTRSCAFARSEENVVERMVFQLGFFFIRLFVFFNMVMYFVLELHACRHAVNYFERVLNTPCMCNVQMKLDRKMACSQRLRRQRKLNTNGIACAPPTFVLVFVFTFNWKFQKFYVASLVLARLLMKQAAFTRVKYHRAQQTIMLIGTK